MKSSRLTAGAFFVEVFILLKIQLPPTSVGGKLGRKKMT
jgi:hypothetical protein